MQGHVLIYKLVSICHAFFCYVKMADSFVQVIVHRGTIYHRIKTQRRLLSLSCTSQKNSKPWNSSLNVVRNKNFKALFSTQYQSVSCCV